MKRFLDKNGYKVEFSENPVFGEPWHVFVLSRYKGRWVLTKHRERGFEFPGGKREAGESIEETAIREVYEETGGLVGQLQFLGQYKVHDPVKPFVKSIYYAELREIVKKRNYLETDGPIFMESLPDVLGEEFSFIMKDEIVPLSLSRLDGGTLQRNE
ncbi:nucleoside triphosphatase YtkD [Bacillus sp. AFS026049]|uniref:RNA deprotection pyrophosphohydrolase n=1 Tax=Peribacillus frigoritolerans TaxID=450367 RepID=UPI000BF31B59|nr:nucleoside triphosphatase YtkD [Peribacillus frigoritolerans]MCR8869322.1 nucleoside triphosphatase YtkD [Peribacillus frigoritolerans]PEO47772.1 nucleoside triphosphatase YtkD [Bacillus sp. AFS026049]